VVRHVRKQVPKYELPGHVKFNTVLRQGRFYDFTPPPLDHDDIAFLQYTGGTTGVAKGAMLTHRNMVSNVLQASTWLCTRTQVRTDVVITALPLYHIFALTANWLIWVQLGAFNVLIPNARDFAAFVAEIAKHRFTYLSGVNTLFNALLNTPGFDRVDFR